MKFHYVACDDYKGLVGMHFLVMKNTETNEWFTKDDYINFIESVSVPVKPEFKQPHQKFIMKKMLRKE